MPNFQLTSIRGQRHEVSETETKQGLLDRDREQGQVSRTIRGRDSRVPAGMEEAGGQIPQAECRPQSTNLIADRRNQVSEA